MNAHLRNAPSAYWDGYYGSSGVPALPSQFAVFALSELPARIVVDVGCGNGRDSLFFARRDIPVLGIDASHAAIESCNASASGEALANARFLCADVADDTLADSVAAAVDAIDEHVLLYSRFFLHAIDEGRQAALFSLASRVLNGRAGWLALEFRTPEDRDRCKVTPAHYRRYVALDDVLRIGKAHGFSEVYSVQGLGFAKYKADDAHVARVLFAVS